MKHLYAFLVLLLIGHFSFGQITENFDTGLSVSYTTGSQTLTSGTWETVQVITEAAGDSRGATGSAARINDDEAGASITTPTLSGGADVVSFWYRELNSGGGTFELQTSTDGVNYTTQTTQAFSGTTYTQFTYTVNNPSPTLTIRVLNDNQAGHLIVDDFEVTAYPVNSLVIGTGTTSTGSTTADPIHGYYAAFKYQVVYTAAQLSATLTPNDEISALGWSIAGDYGGGNLLGYTIKMGHTSATNSAAHDASPTIVVKNAFDYDPTVTAAGVFDMIPFDTNFVWNGLDNILVEVCTDGSNAYTSPYGQVRGTTVTNGSRYYRSDSTTACDVNTNSTNTHTPNIQFNYIDGIPPACINVSGLTIDSFTDTTGTISWSVNGTETDWEIVVQPDATGIPTGAGTAITANPYTLTGLTELTAYEVYVRANCGVDGFSDWVGPVDFTTLPSCPDITGLTMGSVTDTSAAISWTAGGTETAWEIVIQPDATGIPTGAGSATTTNPHTETGLTASTDYEVYVRADCTSASNGYSGWVGPIDFTTTSAPITTFPYNENFEGGAAGWTIDNSTSGSWQLGNPTNTIINVADSGANAWVTNLTGDYNANETSYVISPPFNFSTLAAPVIEFSVWYSSESGYDGMLLQSSIDNGSTWQTIGANGDPDNWYNSSVGWSGASGAWVVAKHDLTGLGGQSSVFLRAAFDSDGSTNGEGVAFDTVNIFQPACPDVTGITIDSFTDTDAVISWTAGNIETDWEIVVQADGTGIPAGTGTATTTNPYSTSGLTAETAYEVYVRADCGANGISEWVGPIDFTTQAACPDVTGLTIDSFSDSEATISWTVDGVETAWEIVVQADGTGAPSGAGTATTTNPHTESGLTAQTAYEVYVRADCTSASDGYSNWVGPVTFTTACSVISTLPFSEDVETTSTTLSCWESINNNADTDSWIVNTSATYANSGSQSFQMYTDYNSGSNDDYLVSPQITLTGNEQLRFQQRVRSSSEPNDFTVLLSTTGSAPADFTNTILANASYSNTTYQEITIDLSTYTGDVYIAFHVPPGGLDGYYLYIDDILVEAIPTCLEVNGITLDSSTPTTATISWTASNAETDWEIVVQPDGTGTPAGSGNTTTTNPHTESGLTAQTAYEVYVRANCLTNGFSAWVGPLAFTTACEAISTLPWTDDLETTSTTLSCWSVNNNNADGDTWSINTSATYANSVSQSYQMYTDYNAGSNDDYLISPQLTLTGNERLRFFERARSSGEPNDFTVLLSTTGTAPADFTTTILANASYSNTTFQELTIDLSAYTGDVYIAFHVPPAGLDGYYLYIDDITVEAIPPCLDVTAVTMTNILDTEATVGWTVGDTETDWEVVVQATGTGTPTGSGTATTANTHTETGLITQTTYEVYVRANCLANGFGNWVGPLEFTTACTGVTSFSENFDAVTTPDLPDCWSSIIDNGASSFAYVQTSTSADNSLPNGVQLYNSGSTDAASNIMLVSPNLSNLGDGTHLLRFYARNTTATQDLEVGTLSSPTDGTTFTPLASVDINTTFAEYEVSFASYSGTDTYIAIRRLSTSTYTSVYLDDIVWEALPPCPDVTGLTVDTLTETTADISWTAGQSETNWEYVIQADGTGVPAGSGTATTTNPQSFTGLTSNTAYEIYVRADCTSGSNGYSEWVGPLAFNTECEVISALPWSDNLETTSTTLSCWSVINNNADGDTWTVASSATYANSGTQSYQMYTDYNSGANDDYLVSPQITLTGNEQLRFFERARSSGEPNDFTVLLSTTGTAPADFTTTILANASYSNTTYQELTVDLSAYTGDVYIAFHVPPAGLDGYYLNIDDIVVEAIPSCFPVTGLTVDSFTSTEATISWTAANAEIDWEIVVQPDGTGEPTGAGTATTTNPHTESGLTAQTAYEVYVRANCLANGISSWVGPVDFTTDCAIYIPDYTEDFATFLNPCWEEAADGDLTAGPASFGSANWGSEEFAHTSSSGGGAVNINMYQSSDVEWLMSPYFDLSIGGYEVSIDVALTNYNSTASGTFDPGDEVRLVYSLDGTNWTTLQIWNQANTPSNTGDTVVTDISTITGSNVQFAVYAVEDGAASSRDIDFHLDNFKVRVPPSCLDITALTIDSFSATDVTVSWTAGDTETAWEIVVQADGTGTPTGAGTATTTNPHTESGLTGQTAYEVYVRADCGPGNLGSWVGPVDFTTPCDAFTPDYTEDFTTFLNPCWEEAQGGDLATGPATTGSGGYSAEEFGHVGTGNGAVNINLYLSGGQDWLLSPTFDLSSGGYQILVDVAMTNYNSTAQTATFSPNDSVDLVYTTDGTNWTSLVAWNQGNTPAAAGETEIVDLSAITGSSIQFAFRTVEDASAISRDIDFHIDNFIVRTAPSCPEPIALTLDTVDRDSATISWTEGGSATAWEIVVQADGTGEPTGAGTATSTNPHTEASLTPATDYEVYVRANCGPGDLSVWVGPLDFTTRNPLPTTTATLDVSACGTSGADTYNVAYDASVSNIVWAQLNYTAGCPSLTIDTIGSDFDTEIGIYDVDGNLVASNDSGGTGITPQSLFTETGLANGTYYIAAGMFNVTFGDDFDVTSSNSTQTGTLYINAEGQSNDAVDFCNLQSPSSGTITEGGTFDAYAQIYQAGITEAAGQGANIQSWIGYSTTDATTTADFTTGWTWEVATYNTDSGNNDEYLTTFGATLTPGVYYYVSRFSVNGGGYSYGGINPGSSGGNFWDGTTAVSGQLTVNSASIPTTVATFNIDGCGDTDSYNAAYAAGTDGVVWVELIYDGNCTEITVDTESTTSGDTEIGLYDVFGNLVGNDDDGGTGTLSSLTEIGLAAGTYYIAAGSYNITFGATDFGATTANTTATGSLSINASTPNFVDFCNLQSPNSGSIVVGGSHDVYAQIYEPSRTDAVGQGANILSWIGYNTTDATTTADFASGWTWVPATYNTDSGNNDEYTASIGSALAVGTYYYVSRFSVDGGDYAYGGINPGSTDGNFWDGTNYVSGVLTINPTPEPTNHVLAFTAVADSDSQITLTWNDNDGAQPADGFVIVGKTGAGVFTTIVDGTDPANDIDWSDDEFEFKRASGLQSYTVVNLDASTLYEFEIYPYTNSGVVIDFKTDGTIPSASATTDSDPCLVAVTTFPFEEGFESGIIPTCWSQETEAGTANWTYNNGNQGGSITSAHTGSFNAMFYDTSSSGVVKLVSPKLDITGIISPTLTFWHAQEAWGADQDELRVYYKTSEVGAWTLIPGQEYLNSISTWTEATIELPNPSAEYYIAFEGTGDYGRGVILDDVKVEEVIAVTYTYTGTWSPSDPNGTATTNDDIIIMSGDAVISATTSADNVTVNPGASLTINTGVTLTVDGDVTLESVSNSYSSLMYDGTIVGTIKYERYVNANSGGNDLISPPLEGETWANFLLSDTNADDLLDNGQTSPTTYAWAPFDKSVGAYVNYTDATAATLTSGTGYRAATDAGTTLTFTGTVRTTTVPINITDEGPNHPDWNLVGNPYPSYIDMFQFLFYEVVPSSGVYNYQLLEDESGIYGYDGDGSNGWDIVTLANSFGRIMAPGQGFLVAANDTQVATYDLTFTPSMRVIGNSDDFIAGRNADVLTYFKLNTTTTANDYTTQFYFNEEATRDADHGYDGKLLDNFAPSFALYSQLVEGNPDMRLALQALHPSDMMDVVIPLGVNANSGEQLTFTISESTLPSTVEVYLDDTLNNTSTLLTSSDYVITPNTNISSTGRFYLRVTDNTLSLNDEDFNSIKIYTKKSPRSIFIQGIINEGTTATIHDIQGRLVYSTDLESNNLVNEIDASDFQDGVYVVTLIDGSQQKSQKVIIR